MQDDSLDLPMDMNAPPRQPTLALAPVGRETVQDRVYSELRRGLISGVFAPAQILTLRGLADALMTSTMPVREALGRLITEQALEALPNRTIRVPPVTLARIDDLLHARILIEGEAVERAATRLTGEGMANIRATMAEWAALPPGGTPDTVDREAALNRAFHFEIYTACGSAVLIPMIESLWLQSGPCTRASILAFSEAGERDAERFHLEMVDALEAKDGPRARAALVADISRPFAFLRNKLLAEGEKP
jgi:DNA-binding GntR family transcriptional regulator